LINQDSITIATDGDEFWERRWNEYSTGSGMKEKGVALMKRKSAEILRLWTG
jgi:hypothetical protein